MDPSKTCIRRSVNDLGYFRPFTKESMQTIKERMKAEQIKKQEQTKEQAEFRNIIVDDLKLYCPNPKFEQGNKLPVNLAAACSKLECSTLLEDVDPYYHNLMTFIVITKGKEIFRFSANNALWLLSPFNVLRRTAIGVLTHNYFSCAIILTILVNSIIMLVDIPVITESTEIVFVGIYTIEMLIKIFARGFALDKFTYLRDTWNWLDFVVIILAWVTVSRPYITLGINVENLTVLRAFRVLRTLKAVAIVPGMKTIVGAVLKSVKNLRDVMILTLISLSVFALLGLQIYMGVNTQVCIMDYHIYANHTNISWNDWNTNKSHWYKPEREESSICGNASTAGRCPENFICLSGYAPSPNYNYTGYDTFPFAFLCTFRLMMQDFWDSLYRMILRATGLWNVIYFVWVVFLGSHYLTNLILATVAMSFDEVQRKAKEELIDALEEEKNVLESQMKKLDSNNKFSQDPADLNLQSNSSLPVVPLENESGPLDKTGCIGDLKSMKHPPLVRRRSSYRSRLSSHNSRFSHQDSLDQRSTDMTTGDIEVKDSLTCLNENDNVVSEQAKEEIKQNEDQDSNENRTWTFIKKAAGIIVFDPFFELFIILTIVLNTVFMAMEFDGVEEYEVLDKTLKIGNKVFEVIFAVECVFKLVAHSPKTYFQSEWNIFDFIVVSLSLLDNILEETNLPGISTFRGFRLMRIFKLAKNWPTLNLLISIMANTIGALGNLVIVLLIILFIFALTGKQLFADYFFEHYKNNEDALPRWNFTDFFHSFMVIFRILCGEWIENMWETMIVYGYWCIPFFISVVIVGNLVVFNLFLALVLSNFGVSSFAPSASASTHNLAEAVKRMTLFYNWIKLTIISFVTLAINQMHTILILLTSRPRSPTNQRNDPNPRTPEEDRDSGWEECEMNEMLPEMEHVSHKARREFKSESSNKPQDCFPPMFYKFMPCCTSTKSKVMKIWSNIRLKSYKIINNDLFDNTIIVIIIVSSVALALEDIHLPSRPLLKDALFYLERVFTIIFLLEMCFKLLGLGFVAYFSNAWCILDFVILMASIVTLVGTKLSVNLQAFKAIRVFKALRPLRAMSRLQGIKVVLNGLVRAIPGIMNVIFVCLMLWLVFAIMGVQLFAGRFYKCIDPFTSMLADVTNKSECLSKNLTWANSKINFDHVGNAYISLFQVATFKGWVEIMRDAVDARAKDEQPRRETNYYNMLYFVAFIVFGSFFTLNLFIGVILDNFTAQKRNAGESPIQMFMTENQKNYYAAIKKMGIQRPLKQIPRPKWKPQAVVFNMVVNQKFDVCIIIVIGLNMFTMTFAYYKMSEMRTFVLDNLNVIFVAIYTVECILKIFGLRCYYLKQYWNWFDLAIVAMSIAEVLLADTLALSPNLFRVFRVAKISRVLHLAKKARGIRTLLFALIMSLPALLNICLLLFVVMFVYSILGMSFFMNVKLTGGLDEVCNFQTFGQSFIILFHISTSAGWDGVFSAIINEDDCTQAVPELDQPGTCGNKAIGIAYLVSFLVINFLILINMYIAVMLENYSHAVKDFQQGVSDDDYDMFFEHWAKVDPGETQYIAFTQLSDFLHGLESPLQILKPNKFKIALLDIPICKDDQIHCIDILMSLTKDYFASKGHPIDADVELSGFQSITDRPNYFVISSTLNRQREEYSARVLQNVFRKRLQTTQH